MPTQPLWDVNSYLDATVMLGVLQSLNGPAPILATTPSGEMCNLVFVVWLRSVGPVIGFLEDKSAREVGTAPLPRTLGHQAHQCRDVARFACQHFWPYGALQAIHARHFFYVYYDTTRNSSFLHTDGYIVIGRTAIEALTGPAWQLYRVCRGAEALP